MTAPERSSPPLAALGSLVMAVVLAVIGWRMLGRAADVGVDRLARIDAMRALCVEAYATARSASDTMRVDRYALPDTIDPMSKDRIAQCGALRGESVPNQLPNPREMNGEEMPRGLR